MVSPIDVPNCAMVLKTAPARPCVFGEKESAMMRFATVKMTIRMLVCSGGAVEEQFYHLLTTVPEGLPRRHSTTMTIWGQ